MIKCKFFDNKKWLTKDKKSENTYQNVLAVFIYYWRIYFCLRSRHSNRRTHQCIFLHLFYVKITLFNKDKMLEKVLKIKNFHPFSRCSNTTHSTCCICGTQKVWVNLLRINSVLPTSSHTQHVVIFCFHTNKQKAMKIILKWYCGTEKFSPVPKETTFITPL